MRALCLPVALLSKLTTWIEASNVNCCITMAGCRYESLFCSHNAVHAMLTCACNLVATAGGRPGAPCSPDCVKRCADAGLASRALDVSTWTSTKRPLQPVSRRTTTYCETTALSQSYGSARLSLPWRALKLSILKIKLPPEALTIA